MKLTNKQKSEVKILKHFIPKNVNWQSVDDEAIKMFFEWSDKGLHKDINKRTGNTGFHALIWAKNRREVQIQMYIEDWGTILNAWSFNEDPKHYAFWVAEKLGKEQIKIQWLKSKIDEYRREVQSLEKQLK